MGLTRHELLMVINLLINFKEFLRLVAVIDYRPVRDIHWLDVSFENVVHDRVDLVAFVEDIDFGFDIHALVKAGKHLDQ